MQLLLHLSESSLKLIIVKYFCFNSECMDFLLQIHFLYQYSLKFFLDIFESVLIGNPHLKDVKDPAARLKILTEDLFQVSGIYLV